MTYFIDSNIFLELELEDERKDECEQFLTKIVEGTEGGIISDFIVYSILIELTQKSTLTVAKNFLNFLEQTTNITIFVPNTQILSNTFNFIKKYKLDFDDALVVSCMMANKIKRLVSFDKDFDKVNEIKRIEPNQI